MELGRAGRGISWCLSTEQCGQESMVFNSVSGRKQFCVGPAVLQHTKQAIFIDTLSIFFSKSRDLRENVTGHERVQKKIQKLCASLTSQLKECFRMPLPCLHHLSHVPPSLLLQSLRTASSRIPLNTDI